MRKSCVINDLQVEPPLQIGHYPRWYNAPHHPEIGTFPHHRHRSLAVEACREVVLEDVWQEIKTWSNPA